MVERWFGELTTKRIRRGAHMSVRALERDITDWIETWNEDPRPYVWVKTAEQILELPRPVLRTGVCGREVQKRRLSTSSSNQ